MGSLKKLKLLSIQSNRITHLENLEELKLLEELYASHNGIEVKYFGNCFNTITLIPLLSSQVIENLDHNINIKTLDLAGNRIKLIGGLDQLTHLEEFWFNDNVLEDWSQLHGLSKATMLATVYFERNPIQKDVNYRRKIKLALPMLQQIDATMCR